MNFKVGQKWKTITGYERYEVSENGEVRNIESGNILKPIIMPNGYYQVTLYNGNDSCRRTIHRLVAKEFIPNITNFPFVCHKDDDKSNNKACNLFWGTAKHNSEDMVKKRRQSYGDKCGASKLSEKEVNILRRLKTLYPKFSNSQLAEIFNTTKSNIAFILNDKTWNTNPELKEIKIPELV